MNTLAIDTSTYLGSVAVLVDGEVRAELSAWVRARHGEVLLPHVEQALTLAGLGIGDVDLLAVGLGPGSFTGVRIGVATVKGLAIGRSLPVVGVVSLRVLARGLGPFGGPLCPVVDAHKGEVYVGLYAPGNPAGPLDTLLTPFHAPPAEAARRLREAVGARSPVLCGDGLRRYGEAFLAHLGQPHAVVPAVHDHPRAALLALEAEYKLEREGPSDLAALEPVYVRPSDAVLPVPVPVAGADE